MYTDAEEHRVIQRIETPVAVSLGGAIRSYHSAPKAIIVDSITYTFNLQDSVSVGIRNDEMDI